MKPFLLLYVFAFLATGFNLTTNQPPTTGVEYIFTEAYRHQWKGVPGYWKWENNVLTGETTDNNPIKQSTFLIWDRAVEDFILNISFRISSRGNSGIYYRCERGPEGYDDLLGYQADIDGQNTYTGIVYENFLHRHRKVLAGQGQLVRISDADSVFIFPISHPGQQMKLKVHENDWNEYELIVKGTTIVQKLNGQITSMVEDKARNRIKKGWFGFQLHQGPPMKVEFRDARFIDLSR